MNRFDSDDLTEDAQGHDTPNLPYLEEPGEDHPFYYCRSAALFALAA